MILCMIQIWADWGSTTQTIQNAANQKNNMMASVLITREPGEVYRV